MEYIPMLTKMEAKQGGNLTAQGVDGCSHPETMGNLRTQVDYCIICSTILSRALPPPEFYDTAFQNLGNPYPKPI